MFQQAFKNIDDVLWKEITAPQEILDQIAKTDAESAKVLQTIRSL